MKIFYLFIPLFFIKIGFCQEENTEQAEIDEDEEIVYSSKEEIKKYDPVEEVKSRVDNLKNKMVDIGYDFSKAIKDLYSNYTNLDLKVMDLEILYRKGVINENQAILIWESLLNTKTERNLEWLGYNKLINKNSSKEAQWKYTNVFVTLFRSPELKYQACFAYFGGIIFFYITKALQKIPKLNMVLILILLIINILNAFYFYNKKFYFTSFICIVSFISNIYSIYVNIVLIAGGREIDYSISNNKHFKSREHFFVKTGVCIFIIAVINYLSSVALRYFMNYLFIFYLMEKAREMIKNFYHLTAPKDLQPFENFISLIFGTINLLYTHIFYSVNIYYSYDLNSFLILNNFITFYYFTSLERFTYIQRNRIGGILLESEKNADRRDKYEVFEELKKKCNLEKNYRNENFSEDNLIDISLIFFCLLFLISGFYFTTYFYLLIAIFILHTIHKNCLIFLSIKISRIISNFLLVVFLLAISNLEKLSFSYINEIIAVYDQKFLEAVLLLFKLLFLVTLAICNYLSEDFIDLFNLYNYSSYKYLIRETNAIVNNSETTRKLNEIYTVQNVLVEIFEFDLATSLDCVNLVLDSINSTGRVNNNSTNIDGFYIDYLMTKNTSNIHIIPLFIDYFLMYAAVWILFDTFRMNNHSFFYVTFILHKIGIFCKFALLMLEYSKTHLQKNIVIFINMILFMRLLSNKELEDLDRIILISFFLATVFIYVIIYENSIAMNIFIFVFNWVMLNNHNNSLPYVSISIGAVIAKIIIQLLNIKHFKVFIFFVCALNSLFIFTSFDKSLFLYFYNKSKSVSISYFKFNVLKILEDICFPISPEGESLTDFYFENKVIALIKKGLHSFKYYNY